MHQNVVNQTLQIPGCCSLRRFIPHGYSIYMNVPAAITHGQNLGPIFLSRGVTGLWLSVIQKTDMTC